jgi:hypothetical protein
MTKIIHTLSVAQLDAAYSTSKLQAILEDAGFKFKVTVGPICPSYPIKAVACLESMTYTYTQIIP